MGCCSRDSPGGGPQCRQITPRKPQTLLPDLADAPGPFDCRTELSHPALEHGKWGQTRCTIYRSGTFNVQRSTRNVQLGDRKGAWLAGYGDRHDVWAVGGANRGTGTIFGPGGRIFDTSELTQRPAGPIWLRRPHMGTDTMFENRSGTFNVQRSTMFTMFGRSAVQIRGTGTIFAPGGRIFDTSELTQRPAGRSNLAAAPTYGDRHDVRYTDQERSTSNVQLATFNWVTEKAHGWQDMGTDTMFDIPIRNVQRETFNSQLSTE